MSSASGNSAADQTVGMSSNGMKSNYDISSSNLKNFKSAAAFIPSGNSYLDSLSMKNIEM
jgi:hypothetical protein